MNMQRRAKFHWLQETIIDLANIVYLSSECYFTRYSLPASFHAMTPMTHADGAL
jgi:hypothetical protein